MAANWDDAYCRWHYDDGGRLQRLPLPQPATSQYGPCMDFRFPSAPLPRASGRPMDAAKRPDDCSTNRAYVSGVASDHGHDRVLGCVHDDVHGVRDVRVVRVVHGARDGPDVRGVRAPVGVGAAASVRVPVGAAADARVAADGDGQRLLQQRPPQNPNAIRMVRMDFGGIAWMVDSNGVCLSTTMPHDYRHYCSCLRNSNCRYFYSYCYCCYYC